MLSNDTTESSPEINFIFCLGDWQILYVTNVGCSQAAGATGAFCALRPNATPRVAVNLTLLGRRALTALRASPRGGSQRFLPRLVSDAAGATGAFCALQRSHQGGSQAAGATGAVRVLRPNPGGIGRELATSMQASECCRTNRMLLLQPLFQPCLANTMHKM